MAARVGEAWPPKSRVRYVPTVGAPRPAVILHKVNDVDAYVIRLAARKGEDGRKLTVSASQLTTKNER